MSESCSDIEPRGSSFWTQILNKLGKTVFYASFRIFWGKRIFSIKSSSEKIRNENFGLLSKFFQQICQNCILRVQRIILKRNNFFIEKIPFKLFQSLIEQEKFSTFWPNFSMGFQSCILRVHRTFLKRNYFFFNWFFLQFRTLGKKAFCFLL